MQALYNNRAATILNFRWTPSEEKHQNYVWTIKKKQLIIMNDPEIVSNLQVHLNYLFIDTYSTAPIHLVYN